MTYKLLAFDMDGTILNSQKQISPEIIRKLEDLQKNSVFIVVATGRGLAEISDYKNDFKAVNYGILISGGIIYDFYKNEVLAVHAVEEEKILKIIEIGLEEGAMIHLLTLNESIANRADISEMEKFSMGIYKKMFERICKHCDDFKEFVHKNPKKVLKVNLYHRNEESRAKTVEKLKNDELQLVFTENTNLEATPKNITKGSGLIELCKKLNIKLEECVSIGDSLNDYEILKISGVGVAMKNSCEKIKKIANFITDDNDNGGFLKALEKFF